MSDNEPRDKRINSLQRQVNILIVTQICVLVAGFLIIAIFLLGTTIQLKSLRVEELEANLIRVQDRYGQPCVFLNSTDGSGAVRVVGREPFIAICDSEYEKKAVIGVITLKAGESKITTPLSSMVLFDEKGLVKFQAP